MGTVTIICSANRLIAFIPDCSINSMYNMILMHPKFLLSKASSAVIIGEQEKGSTGKRFESPKNLQSFLCSHRNSCPTKMADHSF